MTQIKDYIALGKTGLRVSRLALGTMTFGLENGWGSDEREARVILSSYLEQGGNFIDTANVYADGASETIIGHFIKAQNNRHQVVLSTKFTQTFFANDPNSGGNGRKAMVVSLEDSLRRLQTDYIDIYWVHCWDCITPMEEIMSGLYHLVQSGKVRYIGFSNVPAWACAQAQTLAMGHGWEKICALQLPYNPLNRIIECEYSRMAQECGMGICVWSPLAGGFLTGKQTKEALAGRLKIVDRNLALAHGFRKENPWDIIETVKKIAREIGASPAEVALRWVLNKQAVSCVIIGARTPDQLQMNLKANDVILTDEQMADIDNISKPNLEEPYHTFFAPETEYKRMKTLKITGEPKTFRA